MAARNGASPLPTPSTSCLKCDLNSAVKIIFESHGTTFDNEAHRASGWFDVDLSALGEQQAKDLGIRYAEKHLDALFCSDLKRSWRTAELAFVGRDVLIVRDERLRECDYGDFTQQPSEKNDHEKANRISTPFPNGESYEQTTARMKEFLGELAKKYDSKTVMIIGHRATQYALEHLINGVPLHDAVAASWSWQPGWEYTLNS